MARLAKKVAAINEALAVSVQTPARTVPVLVSADIAEQGDAPKDYWITRNGVKYAGQHLTIDLWEAEGLDDGVSGRASIRKGCSSRSPVAADRPYAPVAGPSDVDRTSDPRRPDLRRTEGHGDWQRGCPTCHAACKNPRLRPSVDR